MKKLFILVIILPFSAFIGCSNESSTTTNECIIETIDTSDIPSNTYNIVGTNQTKLFSNSSVLQSVDENDEFYGQDGNYNDLEPLYLDNCDGTITDLNTNLMWSKTTDINNDGKMDGNDKLTYQEAIDSVDNFDLAGYDDWRLPTIKELYSLIIFSGKDVSGYLGTDTDNLIPFIDTLFFDFYYGLTDEGERIIDSQYLSSTTYVDIDNYDTLVFGVNFADGRIKGYGINGMNGKDKTFCIIYVRGNSDYGVNDFELQNDGTIIDHATSLMWMQNGSVDTYNWEEALAFAENFEYAGYDDWRLPNAKELQSIIDYTKSPDTSNSPAIDDLFHLESFINENGEIDWGYYWTSTTHENMTNGGYAVYISFGRALGYMNNNWLDVHGAGAQRSDPKSGDPSQYPYGFGPQGDAIRIYNYVLLVRNSN